MYSVFPAWLLVQRSSKSYFGIFRFEGVKLGTVICALLNGRLIGLFSAWMEKRLNFVDKLPLRKYFE